MIFSDVIEGGMVMYDRIQLQNKEGKRREHVSAEAVYYMYVQYRLGADNIASCKSIRLLTTVALKNIIFGSLP